MGKRTELQTLLETLLDSRNVYFQPPESLKINYPAIVYGYEDIQNIHADNSVYLSHRRYAVTLIDRNPDSHFVDLIAQLPTCQFNRHYKGENLNHWSFSLYF